MPPGFTTKRCVNLPQCGMLVKPFFQTNVFIMIVINSFRFGQNFVDYIYSRRRWAQILDTVNHSAMSSGPNGSSQAGLWFNTDGMGLGHGARS